MRNFAVLSSSPRFRKEIRLIVKGSDESSYRERTVRWQGASLPNGPLAASWSIKTGELRDM
jgi:hypothetical protein